MRVGVDLELDEGTAAQLAAESRGPDSLTSVPGAGGVGDQRHALDRGQRREHIVHRPAGMETPQRHGDQFRPEARTARTMASVLENLPVPSSSREEKMRSPSLRPSVIVYPPAAITINST
jgi:hypothetical protein